MRMKNKAEDLGRGILSESFCAPGLRIGQRGARKDGRNNLSRRTFGRQMAKSASAIQSFNCALPAGVPCRRVIIAAASGFAGSVSHTPKNLHLNRFDLVISVGRLLNRAGRNFGREEKGEPYSFPRARLGLLPGSPIATARARQN